MELLIHAKIKVYPCQLKGPEEAKLNDMNVDQALQQKLFVTLRECTDK